MSNHTLPVVVPPEAETYIAELGMQSEFAEMIEFLLQHAEGLRAIEVSVQPPYDLGGDPCVLISPLRYDGDVLDKGTRRAWTDWRISTFSPEVLMHFVLF